MNNKNRFYFLLLALFAIPISAETPTKQELQEQLAVKQQELREITDKIAEQESRKEKILERMNASIKKYMHIHEMSGDHDRKKILNELGEFSIKFEKNNQKYLLYTDFLKSSSVLALAKLYYIYFDYEKACLGSLILKWEDTARQIDILVQEIKRLEE